MLHLRFFGPAARSKAKKLASVGPKSASKKDVCSLMQAQGASPKSFVRLGLQGNLEAGSRFVARHICQRLAQNGARPAWECFHGLGHGVVQFHRPSAGDEFQTWLLSKPFWDPILLGR